MAGNPYHDAKGLFSTASGDADGNPSYRLTPKELAEHRKRAAEIMKENIKATERRAKQRRKIAATGTTVDELAFKNPKLFRKLYPHR